MAIFLPQLNTEQLKQDNYNMARETSTLEQNKVIKKRIISSNEKKKNLWFDKYRVRVAVRPVMGKCFGEIQLFGNHYVDSDLNLNTIPCNNVMI